MKRIGEPHRQPDGFWKYGHLWEGEFFPSGYCGADCGGHSTPEDASAHYEQFLTAKQAVRSADEQVRQAAEFRRIIPAGKVAELVLPSCRICGAAVTPPDLTALRYVPLGLGAQLDLCDPCMERAALEQDHRDATVLREELLKKRDQAWAGSGVPDLLLGESFSTFRLDGVAPILQDNYWAALEWADTFDPQRYRETRGLLFTGPVGTGKSHLAAAIARRVVERMVPDHDALVARQRRLREAALHSDPAVYQRMWQADRLPIEHYTVRFEVAPEVLGRVVDARIPRDFSEGKRVTEEDVYQQVSGPRLLILDDLGRVLRTSQAGQQEMVWYRIFNARYNARLPMIVTTNAAAGELAGIVGEAVYDRLWQMFDFLDMRGESFRPRKRQGR